MSDTKSTQNTKSTENTISIRGFANDEGYQSYTLEQLWKDTNWININQQLTRNSTMDAKYPGYNIWLCGKFTPQHFDIAPSDSLIVVKWDNKLFSGNFQVPTVSLGKPSPIKGMQLFTINKPSQLPESFDLLPSKIWRQVKVISDDKHEVILLLSLAKSSRAEWSEVCQDYTTSNAYIYRVNRIVLCIPL